MSEENIHSELSLLKEKLDGIDLNDIDAEVEYQDLINMRKKINQYGQTIEGTEGFITYSYTNLRESYNNKLHVTAMIGYLNRACDEWHVPEDLPVIPVNEYIDDNTLIDSYHKDWKKIDDKLQKKIDENKEWMEKRVIVKQFLQEMFRFNPDEHVRSAYCPNPEDKERDILETSQAKLAIELKKKKDHKFADKMFHYERVNKLAKMGRSINSNSRFTYDYLNELDKKVDIMNYDDYSNHDEKLFYRVYNDIPPHDIFHRFNYYLENNWNELTEAVKNLYCDKPEFEIALNPYSYHSTLEDAEKFVKKHRDEVITSVYIGSFGKWNLMTPYKANQERIKFYNSNTRIIEQMFEQMELDQKLGADMMRKRVKKKKKENISEEGPDSEAFRKWKAQNSTLKKMGAEALDDDDCPEDALEVDVFVNEGNDLKKGKFYTKAEGLEQEED
jgi:hypothetical protein